MHEVMLFAHKVKNVPWCISRVFFTKYSLPLFWPRIHENRCWSDHNQYSEAQMQTQRSERHRTKREFLCESLGHPSAAFFISWKWMLQ